VSTAARRKGLRAQKGRAKGKGGRSSEDRLNERGKKKKEKSISLLRATEEVEGTWHNS